jgi:hypothetical protein
MCFWILYIILFVFKMEYFGDCNLSPSSVKSSVRQALSIELDLSQDIWMEAESSLRNAALKKTRQSITSKNRNILYNSHKLLDLINGGYTLFSAFDVGLIGRKRRNWGRQNFIFLESVSCLFLNFEFKRDFFLYFII